MDEQKLKDIEAPKKEGGVTLKQKRINTYIFTAVSSILNLFFMIALVFGLIFFVTWIFRTLTPNMTQEEFSKWVNPIMWFSVILGIWFSLFIQKYVIRFVIKVFKWEEKFELTFVEKYLGKK